MEAFENPVADGDNAAPVDPTAKTKGDVAASDQEGSANDPPEYLLEGTALGFLGSDNPLRVVLFKLATHM